MATVNIESVHPLDSALGQPLKSTISVIFNQLMDETTITESTFMVSGPESSEVGSGSFSILQQNSGLNYSYIEGSIRFETITGTKTKAIFEPSAALDENTEYIVYLIGDEGNEADDVGFISALDLTPFIGVTAWRFTTGTGSISDVPTDTSNAQVADGVLPVYEEGVVLFEVASTVPENRATNVTTSTEEIHILLSKEPDDSTLSTGIRIYSESVNGDTSITSDSDIEFVGTVDENQITLELSESLLSNNMVVVEVNSLLKDTDGNSLSDSGYEFYFATSYSPLYTNIRRIKLEIGPQLVGVPDDTINLAIFEASRTADLLSANAVTANLQWLEHARRQFVICEAQGLLLQGISSEYIVKSKKLADFSVDYDTGYLPRIMNKISDCIDKWQPVLMGGGADYKDLAIGVKGLWDPNRPTFGRTWESKPGSVPAINTKAPYFGRWVGTWERYKDRQWLT